MTLPRRLHPNVRVRPARTDPKLLSEAFAAARKAAHVRVHCHIPPSDDIGPWWIQRTTWLVDRHSNHRSRLLHSEGMPHPPGARPGIAFRGLDFLLLFEPLPTSCVLFDLVEETSDLFPFRAKGLVRNDQDIYRVTLRED